MYNLAIVRNVLSTVRRLFDNQSNFDVRGSAPHPTTKYVSHTRIEDNYKTVRAVGTF
jgi:hypothetical protein